MAIESFRRLWRVVELKRNTANAKSCGDDRAVDNVITQYYHSVAREALARRACAEAGWESYDVSANDMSIDIVYQSDEADPAPGRRVFRETMSQHTEGQFGMIAFTTYRWVKLLRGDAFEVRLPSCGSVPAKASKPKTVERPNQG